MKSSQPDRSTLFPIFATLLVLAAIAAPAGAQGPPSACDLTQVTSSSAHDSFAGGLSADGRFLALTSQADHTGGNPDQSRELFLYDRATEALAQLTDLAAGYVHQPVLTADGARIFYRSNYDPEADELLATDALIELDRASGVRTVVARDFLAAAVSGDGSRVALLSRENPTGGNADGNAEVFLLDLETGLYLQITDTLAESCSGIAPRCPSNLEPRIDADGSRVAFLSDYDLDASGDEASYGGIFVYDVPAETLTRVTANADPALELSGDGTAVAFASYENLTGGGGQSPWLELFVKPGLAATVVQVPGNQAFLNAPAALDHTGSRFAYTAAPQAGQGRNAYLFDVDGGGVAPLLAAPGVDDFVIDLTPDGAWASLHSKANLAGGNPDGGFEVFVAQCADETVPPPPEGEWLESDAVPGFRFKVRITADGEAQPVRLESDCIPETACVSGALPGRSELFVRVIGPRPNGKLWPVLVRFTTSRVEVWIEQLSSSDLEYYVLDAASPGSSDLTGFFDRDGFEP